MPRPNYHDPKEDLDEITGILYTLASHIMLGTLFLQLFDVGRSNQTQEFEVHRIGSADQKSRT